MHFWDQVVGTRKNDAVLNLKMLVEAAFMSRSTTRRENANVGHWAFSLRKGGPKSLR